MKEHAFFLQAGFTPANPTFSEKASYYQKEFEALLRKTISLGNGLFSQNVLCSGEVVTEFTALAEKQSQCFTTIPIDQEITAETLSLKPRSNDCHYSQDTLYAVRVLNRTALKLLEGLISLKESILKCVLSCEMFTGNYPTLLEHIIHEAKLYQKYVTILEKEGDLPDRVAKDGECFWNQIMMEHAQFIRGLLDPCETQLFDTANTFSKEYCALVEASRCAHNKALTQRILSKTLQFRDFKSAGAQGILECRIRSIILPLLADHVLREANHYIRVLR
jgi:hypothetical protein